MLIKRSRNLGIDGTITRAIVVIIKSMAHVYNNTLLSIFMGSDTIVFWKMSLLHWLTKLTHQILYREKTIGEALWKQWRHGDWMLKTVSEITFCLIRTTGFVRIVIRTWFTKNDFVIDYYYYYFHYHFYFSIVFIMMITVISLVFLLSLLLILA